MAFYNEKLSRRGLDFSTYDIKFYVIVIMPQCPLFLNLKVMWDRPMVLNVRYFCNQVLGYLHVYLSSFLILIYCNF